MLSHLIIFNAYARAQCPPAACIPGNASDPSASDFHTGIFGIRLGTYSAEFTTDSMPGYRDFTCVNRNINVTAGISYALSITNGDIADENVRVWADLNNNAVFESNELIFSGNSAKVHNGFLVFPESAVIGVPLRIRFASDLSSVEVPVPCGRPVFGQYQDYAIVITSNSLPPVANFTTADSITCTGTVRFTDLSMNFPQTYAWDFGDGATSAESNPVHIYSSRGTYSVKLTTTNANGSSVITKTGIVHFNGAAPIAALCTPVIAGACCNYTLRNIRFGQVNTIGAPAPSGYNDYSCRYQATATSGSRMNVSGFVNQQFGQNIKVWIDYDNNGAFADSEIIFSMPNQRGRFSTVVQLPRSAVENTPLRVRFVTDFVGSTVNACINLATGFVQDYGLTIIPNTELPEVSFSADTQNFYCTGAHTFTYTASSPVDSLIWDFGDGETAHVTGYETTHTYAAPGFYNVSLTAVNSIGSATLTKNRYIAFYKGGVTPSCYAETSPDWCCNYGITGFRIRVPSLPQFLNNSANGSVGYQDFSCLQLIPVVPEEQIEIGVWTGTSTEFGAIYIDYDTNGTFSLAERIFSWGARYNQNFTNFTLPADFPRDVPVRLRVVAVSDQQLGGSAAPCGSILGQSEDYAIILRSPTIAPVANYSVSTLRACTGENVAFDDNSTNMPLFRNWIFGDGTFINNGAKSVTHAYSLPGTYLSMLVVANAIGADTFVTEVKVTSPQVMRNACEPTVNAQSSIDGIQSVIFAGINNETVSAVNRYTEFACRGTEVIAGSTYTLSIRSQPGNNGPGTSYVGVYIDWNNSGSLDEWPTTNEKILHTSGITNDQRVTIPLDAVRNVPIRMRVIEHQFTDFFGTIPVCGPIRGEVEDYPIIVRTTQVRPVARFSVNNTRSCNPAVSFTDNSTNVPVTRFWNFGDGFTSTETNPVHTYAQPGTYTVKLKVTNESGADSLTQQNYVTVLPPSAVRPSACTNGISGRFNNPDLIGFTLADLAYTSDTGKYQYTDHTCYASANVTAGNFYSLNVKTAQDAQIGVYIDWNADGIFTESETVARTFDGAFSYSTRNFTKNIFIPAYAVSTEPLRVHVVLDNNFDFIICSQLNVGHSEDFAIMVASPRAAPVARFDASSNLSCTGVVTFRDSSRNVPAEYFWDFGDGTYSTLTNPVHSYNSPGTYSVKLRVRNAFGADSLTRLNYVIFTSGRGLIPTSCRPAMVNDILTGITRYSLAGLIGNATIGVYADKACSQQARVEINSTYTLTATTAHSALEVACYIDWNNNGTFGTDERVITFNNTGTAHSGSITVPAYATTGVALRARLLSNANGEVEGPCNDIGGGNAVDFAVIVSAAANTLPGAAFIAFDSTSCNGYIRFLNKTRNLTATYLWRFGDGETSVETNPEHTYTNAGTYTVKLIALNATGADSLVRTSYIHVSGFNGPVPAACYPVAANSVMPEPIGIRNVTLGGISVSSGTAEEGYRDFTCQSSAELSAGEQAVITVKVEGHENIKAWIDYNGNGSFEGVEQIADLNNVTGIVSVNFTVPENFAAGHPVRLRVQDDFVYSPNNSNPCAAPQYGQAEDYSVINVTGISTAKPKNLLSIFPNPGSGLFHISANLPTVSDAEILVYSPTGQLVWFGSEKAVSQINREIDLGNLAKGLYLLRMQTGSGITIHKLVIE
ncbi:MAG: PKD domain-containing protein [Bacteroidota bacterium]